jgi:hypothetical protein
VSGLFGYRENRGAIDGHGAMKHITPDKVLRGLECVGQENYIGYAKEGIPICPNCKSTEAVVETGERGEDWYEITSGSRCDACGAEWLDEYRLIGYTNVTFRGGG